MPVQKRTDQSRREMPGGVLGRDAGWRMLNYKTAGMYKRVPFGQCGQMRLPGRKNRCRKAVHGFDIRLHWRNGLVGRFAIGQPDPDRRGKHIPHGLLLPPNRNDRPCYRLCIFKEKPISIDFFAFLRKEVKPANRIKQGGLWHPHCCKQDCFWKP